MQNPFNYIKIDMNTERVTKWNKVDIYNTEDVEKISNKVCANEETSLLMQSIIHMMIDTYEINWLTSERIILLAGQKECYCNENSKQTNLDELFEFIRKEDDNHIAVIKYDEFNELPVDVTFEAIKQLEVDLLNFVANEKSVVVNEKTVEELGIRCINCPNMRYVEGRGAFCMHDMLEESAAKYEDINGEKISKNKKAIDEINSSLNWCPLIYKLLQSEEIETIKERTINIKLSDADCDRLTKKCIEFNMTVSELFENFISDLVDETYLEEWIERCWSSNMKKRTNKSRFMLGLLEKLYDVYVFNIEWIEKYKLNYDYYPVNQIAYKNAIEWIEDFVRKYDEYNNYLVNPSAYQDEIDSLEEGERLGVIIDYEEYVQDIIEKYKNENEEIEWCRKFINEYIVFNS